GVLADDMGLGKTLQLITHLLSLKQGGALTQPALVVVPTSLIPNWQSEIARFAPTLKVLTLHGPQRAEDFDQLGAQDIVLTSYALLPRDVAPLRQQPFALIVGRGAAGEEPAHAGAPRPAQPAHGTLCLPHRHPAGKPPGRTVVADRPRRARPAWRRRRVPASLPAADRKTARRGMPATPEPAAGAVHPAPDQGPGGEGVAAEDRDHPPRGTGRAPARTLRRPAPVAGGGTARGDRAARHRALRHRGAGRAAEAAPGLLRPAAGETGGRARCARVGQVRAADGHAAGAARRGPQGAAVLAVHRHVETDLRRTRSPPHPLRHAYWRYPRPRRAGAAFPGWRGAAVPVVAEGRRRGPQPHRRRYRDPLRPVVESRRRGAGQRPCAPHRPGQAGVRVPPDHLGHGRRAHRGTETAQGRTRRRRARGRRQPRK